MRSCADYFVSMNSAERSIDVGVDSLNVSVAVAVIAADFLRKPHRNPAKAEGDLGF